MAKAEKKPKRSLGYNHVRTYTPTHASPSVNPTPKNPRDLQNAPTEQAVARLDNLEFLTDVVPKTTSYKDAKGEREKKKAAQAAAQEAAHANGTAPANGQTTITAAATATTNGQPTNGQAAAGAEKDESENGGGEAMDVDPTPTPAP